METPLPKYTELFEIIICTLSCFIKVTKSNLFVNPNETKFKNIYVTKVRIKYALELEI